MLFFFKVHTEKYKYNHFSSGFTLIELLVVMGLLGILLGGALLLINPVEQINRSADTSRIQAIEQLRSALERRAIANYSTPHPFDLGYAYTGGQQINWMTTHLVNSSELKSVPTNENNPTCLTTTATSPTGNGVRENNFCYRYTTSPPVGASIWVRLRSQDAMDKANLADPTNCPGINAAYYVWSSTLNRAGYTCYSPSHAWPNANTFLYTP